MKVIIVLLLCAYLCGVFGDDDEDMFGCDDRFNESREVLTCLHFPQDNYISETVKTLWIANTKFLEWENVDNLFPNLQVRIKSKIYIKKNM